MLQNCTSRYGKFQIITLRHFLFIPVHRRRVFSVGINPFYTSGTHRPGDYAFSRFSPLRSFYLGIELELQVVNPPGYDLSQMPRR